MEREDIRERGQARGGRRLGWGVDLEMLEYNLALAPKERARQHDAALALVLELNKQAGERMRANDLAVA